MEEITGAFRDRFDRDPGFLARAPGRVEFIGNHTDYNGGCVLGAAVDRFLTVALAPRSDGRMRFASANNPEYVVFESARTALETGAGWVRYPLGVLSFLGEAGVALPGGFDFLVSSEIPAGAGLSSSAAFELASSIAFESMAGRALEPMERVRLCRRAENEVVGVPCGILDQGVSGFGEPDRLVHIDCATERIRTVPGPAAARLWIFDSGEKHSLVDGLYSRRHAECREAFEILRARVPGLDWLAHADPEDLGRCRDGMPEAVYRRAFHVIHEHRRVGLCEAALAAGDRAEVGRLLFESHRSSSKYFENSIEQLDMLVDLLAAEEGVIGARLTGGGFGGAVMALCGDGFSDRTAGRVAGRFAERFGHRPACRSLSIAGGAKEVTLS
ncbi:MAG: galactokinase [Puniceicoccaceae bacterium]